MSIRFPQEAHLRDERRLIIRPFTEGDVEALWEFFNRLPLPVRRYAWEDFEHRETVERWARDLDYDKRVPLLALDGDNGGRRGAPHVPRRRPPAARGTHPVAARTPTTAAPASAPCFINDFMTIARDSGLKHLTCLLYPDLDEAAVVTLKEPWLRLLPHSRATASIRTGTRRTWSRWSSSCNEVRSRSLRSHDRT